MYELLHYRFWALLDAIFKSDATAQLISLEPNEARILLGKNRIFVVLVDEQPKERIALQNWLKVLLEENPDARQFDVVVLAPTHEIDSALSDGRFQVPWTTRLAVLTVSETGEYSEITNKQADDYARTALDQSLNQTGSVDDLKATVRARLYDQNRKVNEVNQFRTRLTGDSAAATYALLVAVFAYFGVQWWFGSTTYTPGLLLLGADSPTLVAQGQYWRLFTCMFLHGGLLHIAMNSYVLYALGKFFNKLIGNARFLILFFASGLCGSIASVLISKPTLSVGASGALWGLFGLSAALIVKPSGFLPDAVRQNLRNVTIFNLAINIALSFSIAFIDKWAHFGGGIAGFLIGLAFVFEPEYRARRIVHRTLASVFVALAALSFVAQWYYEKPWVLSQPVKLVDQPLFDGKMTISVPSFLKLVRTDTTFSQYGEFSVSPYQINVYKEASFANADSHLEMLARKLAAGELGGIDSKVVSVKISQIGNFETAALTIEFNPRDENGRVVEDDIRHLWVWAQNRGNEILYVTIAAQSETPKVLVDNLEQIIESVRLPIRI